MKRLSLKTGILLAILFLLSFYARSQNKDSLLKVVPAVKDEKERIRIIYLIIGDSGDNDPEKALYYYKKILELTHQLNDKVAEAVVTAEMGYAIYSIGNTVQGTETIIKACRLAEDIGNQQAIGIAYNNLAIAYDDPGKRRELFDKALIASTAANDYLFMCWDYGNIGDILLGQKKMDSAFYYKQRALEIALAHKIEERIPGTMVGVGRMYFYLNQKQLGLTYVLSASKEPYTQKDAKAAASVYKALCGYFLSEKKYDSALYYAHLSYQRTKNAFYRIQLMSIPYVAFAYEKANKPDSALKYFKIYSGMKDSMNNKLKIQQTQLQLSAEEDRKNTLNKEHQSNIQYAAIALGVVGLLILFLVFSHSIIANQTIIRFLGILSLLIVFEFLNLLLHPFLEKITHHQPLVMLSIMVGIAALLIPLHHKLEHWITHKLVEKNNRIRLAKAKKTIEELEAPKA